MDLHGVVEQWLFKVALRKMVLSASKVLLALLASAKVAPVLVQFGVTVDPDMLRIGLTALGTAGLTALHDWVKLKTGLKFL